MYKITLKLQQMRNLKHMTQKRLAFLANISQGHISELETGNKSPTLKTVEGLADALKTSPCDLLEVDTFKNENKIRLNWKRLEK
ncbi:helix-turn-helix domain-containing protein [Clostridium sp.]|uniref:helix-turn-helix domain-containing protein n=1 Tax=Clostridium sp. TaxID=1506 RepID=UPI002616B3EA|nr:helix-turn-helix transcriptional regulator [uncultured Clostridium sp.]